MIRRTAPLSRRSFIRLGGGAIGAGITLVSGCGSASSTGGKRLTLATRVEAESLSFTNDYDFEIELTRALVSIGPLRFLEGAPVARQNLLDRLLGIGVAHAHPGHYVAGGVLGEMLVPTSVDLAAGATNLGDEPGVSGVALSGQFSFLAPPTGPFAEALGGNVVLLEGTARKDSRSLAFRVLGRTGDVINAEGEPIIAGCEFFDGELVRDGFVDLTVRPSVWLDQVDFSEVPESDSGEVVTIDPAGRPHKAFARGLLKASAYHFRFTPNAG